MRKKLSWTDGDIRCPFYIADDRTLRTINCEGFLEKSVSITRFHNLAQRDRHMGAYCVNRYEKCPVYKSTYECKYKSGGETK